LAVYDSEPSKFKFQNVGEFEFRGIEASLDAQLTSSFQARACYTHLDPGVHTTGRPGEKVDLSLRWILGKLSLSSTGQYVTNYYAEDGRKEPIPAYLVVDTKMSYQILRQLAIFAAVDNVFDEDYVTYANLPGSAAGLYAMPRRRLTTGLDLRL
jgi:outer membrane receptor protein involved in Fe transport